MQFKCSLKTVPVPLAAEQAKPPRATSNEFVHRKGGTTSIVVPPASSYVARPRSVPETRRTKPLQMNSHLKSSDEVAESQPDLVVTSTTLPTTVVSPQAAASSGPRIVLLNLLQICDSAFPISGFTHSGGVEAGWRRGAIPTVEHLQRFLKICVVATCSQQVPYVAAAYAAVASLTPGDRSPDSSSVKGQLPSGIGESGASEWICRLADLDRTLSVSLSNHVARRASLQQGRSLLSLAVEVFPSAAPLRHLESLRANGAMPNGLDRATTTSRTPATTNGTAATAAATSFSMNHHGQIPLLKFEAHLAVVFGALCSLLGAQRSETLDAFAFSTLRNSLSAAVRLGRVGPVLAQKLQHDLSGFCVRVAERYSHERCGQGDHQTSPILDIYQNSQDRLFTKMFYS